MMYSGGRRVDNESIREKLLQLELETFGLDSQIEDAVIAAAGFIALLDDWREGRLMEKGVRDLVRMHVFLQACLDQLAGVIDYGGAVFKTEEQEYLRGVQERVEKGLGDEK